MKPNLTEEKKLWRRGYKRVVSLDESGRGPLAASVVAAAVMVNRERLNLPGRFDLKTLKDSKKLTPQKREEFYIILTRHPDIKWGIGRVSERVIDRINILEATKLAMKRAVEKLKRKPDFLIIDGNFKINSAFPQKSIVKADKRVFSCVCAGIIAKVYRDRIMQRYHKKYPQYGFDRHKGYPTKLHRKMLRRYGPCEIHRKSFRPVLKSK